MSMKNRRRKIMRRVVIWFSRVIMRVDLRNQRPCGCVDMYPKGETRMFHLLPCDSCASALARMLGRTAR
jgi:hypothetical protein